MLLLWLQCVCVHKMKEHEAPAVIEAFRRPTPEPITAHNPIQMGGSHRESLTFQSRALPTPSEGLTTIPHSYQTVGGLTILSLTGTSLYLHTTVLSQQLCQGLGALPEPPFTPSSWTHSTTTHPMTGPYQTPTNPTKTDQMKINKTKLARKSMKRKGSDHWAPSVGGVTYHQPSHFNGVVLTPIGGAIRRSATVRIIQFTRCHKRHLTFKRQTAYWDSLYKKQNKTSYFAFMMIQNGCFAFAVVLFTLTLGFLSFLLFVIVV